MALGGFIFAGYKCTKPENATDAEWALLIHKTRLKAFMEANTLAGDIWVQDWDEGTIDFEAGDGMIYDLNSDGLDLVSFFKHKTEDKYYMVASLFKWTPGNFSGVYKVSESSIQPSYFVSSSNYVRVYNKQLFHTVGYDRFTPDCLSYTSNSYPSRALCLIPIGGWLTNSSTNFSVGINETNSFGSKSKFYTGYALRGKDIITITTFDLSINSPQNYLKTSLVGFDSLNLSSPNDTANIYGLCLDVDYYDTGYQAWSSTGQALTYCQETLKNNFTRYAESSKWSTLFLSSAQRALFEGTPDSIPYEAALLTTGSARNQSPYLNSDGITTKGSFNPEVLSTNGQYPYSLSKMTTYANGNYLMVAYFANHIQTSICTETCYYIGWDPSNPDITSEDAWTAYNG